MSYKSIDEQFWTDPFIQSLTIKQRYFYFYLITNPHTHYCGLYYLPLSIIAEETGLTLREVKLYVHILEERGKIRYDTSYKIMWVINMAKYQLSHGECDNRLKGIAKHFETLHGCPLIGAFLEHYVELQVPYKGLLSPSEAPREKEEVKEKIKEKEKKVKTEQSSILLSKEVESSKEENSSKDKNDLDISFMGKEKDPPHPQNYKPQIQSLLNCAHAMLDETDTEEWRRKVNENTRKVMILQGMLKNPFCRQGYELRSENVSSHRKNE